MVQTIDLKNNANCAINNWINRLWMENVRIVTKKAELFKVQGGLISAKSQRFLQGAQSPKTLAALQSSHALFASIKIGLLPRYALTLLASKCSDEIEIGM